MTNDRVQPKTESTEKISSHHAERSSLSHSASLTDPKSNEIFRSMTAGRLTSTTAHDGTTIDFSAGGDSGSGTGSGRLNPSEWHNYGKTDKATDDLNLDGSSLDKTRTFEPRDGKKVSDGAQPASTEINTSFEHANRTPQDKDPSKTDDGRGVTRTEAPPPPIMEGPPHRDPVHTERQSDPYKGSTGEFFPKDGKDGNPANSSDKGKMQSPESMPPAAQPIDRPFGPTQDTRDAAKDKVKKAGAGDNGLTDAQNQMVSNIQNAVLQGNLSGLQTAIKDAAGDPEKLKDILSAAQSNLQAAGSDMNLTMSGNNVFLHDGISSNALEINPQDGSTTVRPLSRESGKVTAMPGEVLSRDAQSVLDGMSSRAIVEINPDKSFQAPKPKDQDQPKTQQRPMHFPPVYDQSTSQLESY